MPNWSEGDEAAEVLAEEAAKRRGSGRFRVQTLSIAKGADFVFRPYTDRKGRIVVPAGDGAPAVTHPGWISVDAHQFIPTKDQPAEYTGDKWPQKMWAICPNDRMFRVREGDELTDSYEPGYGNCYLHTALAGQKDARYGYDLSIPSAQVIGLAVLREAVHGDSANPKKVTAFTDKTVEWYDSEGNMTKIPHFVIFSQRYDKFWAAIAAAGYMDQTACNKDFWVRRGPDDKSKIEVSSINMDPSFVPGTDRWKAMYDETLKLIGFDLREWVLDHARLDHYKRWFIPGAVPEGGYDRRDKDGTAATEGSDSGGVPANGTPVASGIDQDKMNEFAASLATRGS
jgi:hypothetical protein